mmetsp:Transcript_3849/g.7306  ORF Transcript_3849/g.7306 Transcript_3849/m.7306 type:complete len:112 (-) Transcript_3849:506-841(-)
MLLKRQLPETPDDNDNHNNINNNNTVIIDNSTRSTKTSSHRKTKKDIGRKAIRSNAANLDYVHKSVPKSKSSCNMIMDAISHNMPYKACSREELLDLADAFKLSTCQRGAS